MKPYILLFLLVSVSGLAQKPEYAVALIPPELKENANAVVRDEQIDINITSRSAMTVRTYRAVTVLNELGQRSIDAGETYNIKTIGAVVYDSNGKELKKLKRKDFREASVSQGSMISDGKIVYLEYTPTQYPFTIVYESETSDSNTAFIPKWQPLPGKWLGVEKSAVNVTCAAGLGFKYKEYNFGNRAIVKEEKSNGISYTASNLQAVKNEDFSPPFRKMMPYVMFGLEKFNLEGVDGQAKSWEDFGAWNYSNLLSGTDELTPETQARIKALVGDENDPVKKARIVYKYVQDKTRYVSIQLGIGGWRPMKAKDVDRLGYGDCKALSNYTRALLEVVGVPSYYTIIHSGDDKIDIQQDFVSMQGDHVILAVPNGNDIKWLECTSQTVPFDYQGNFTDDRLALLVKPEGSELVSTHVYSEKDNSQLSKGQYAIDGTGTISGNIEIRTKGNQYRNRLELERKSTEELNTFYREYFTAINNLKLEKINVANDKDKPEFTENLVIAAPDYASLSNNRLMFAVNAFNQYSHVPQRYRTRSNPFEIERGFYDQDEITIALPEGFAVEARPADMEVSDAYGRYKAEFSMPDAGHILYKRTLLINKGEFPASDYEKFRKFTEQIAKDDNAKIVLVKK